MTTRPLLRIGTRRSPLALAQTYEVRERLAAAHPDLAAPGAVEIVEMITTGDAIQDRALSEIGGKGLFTKELDDAMLNGGIDLAVHSMKDVATVLPEGIVLPCMLPREDPRDAFMCLKGKKLSDLPAGAVVGTASLRRGAQILARFPHLNVEVFRGNVQTRMRKLSEGVVDATLLAVAGLNRLGLIDHAAGILPVEEMLPAVGQGAIGITCRAGDEQAHRWLAALTDADTVLRVTVERAFLAALDGSCRTPIAGLAEVMEDGSIYFSGLIVRPDGSEQYETTFTAPAAEAAARATAAAEALKAKAGPGFLTTTGA